MIIWSNHCEMKETHLLKGFRTICWGRRSFALQISSQSLLLRLRLQVAVLDESEQKDVKHNVNLTQNHTEPASAELGLDMFRNHAEYLHWCGIVRNRNNQFNLYVNDPQHHQPACFPVHTHFSLVLFRFCSSLSRRRHGNRVATPPAAVNVSVEQKRWVCPTLFVSIRNFVCGDFMTSDDCLIYSRSNSFCEECVACQAALRELFTDFRW